MSNWDIQPSGVSAVLTQTQTTAAGLETEATAFDNAVIAAAGECGSNLVANALAGFRTAKFPQLQFIFARTTACMNGASQATQAYINGDLEMAANAQASASSAPTPTGMPGGGGITANSGRNIPQ